MALGVDDSEHLHVRRDYEPVQGSGESCGDILDALPESFDWTTCAVHAG